MHIHFDLNTSVCIYTSNHSYTVCFLKANEQSFFTRRGENVDRAELNTNVFLLLHICVYLVLFCWFFFKLQDIPVLVK